jgi:hypothetical protein
MSIRPTSAAVRAVAVGPLSNRLHAVLAVGMRSNPVVSTGVVYSDEPPRLINDRQWYLDNIEKDVRFFGLVPEELRNDREFAKAALQIDHRILIFFPNFAFQNDKAFVKMVLEGEPWYYEDLTAEMQHDEEIIRFVLSHEDFRLNMFPPDVKVTRDHLRLAIRTNWYNSMYIPDKEARDREFMFELMEIDPKVVHFVTAIRDEDFWLKAIGIYPYALSFLPSEIPRTVDFLVKAMRANGYVMKMLELYWNNGRRIKIESFDDFGDLDAIQNSPQLRLAAATAVRNPNMEMMGAILNDMDVGIKLLVKETLIVETESARKARMERLEGYQLVLEKLAKVPMAPDGPMDTKIQELAMLLNSPTKSEDLFKYRMERDLGDMLEETPRANKARVATETLSLAAGFAMPRQPVKLPTQIGTTSGSGRARVHN